MKRSQEKIKDFVEPQVCDEVQHVVANPARALAAYRFTDATSELLARWLDTLADLPRGRGAARALAGSRGVGKSHMLAVLGALAAVPELRSRVADAHVATSARRLAGRQFKVVRVERGLRPALHEEVAAGLAATFGGDASKWGDTSTGMMLKAVERAGDAILLVIVDTAFGRESRVRRDDGPELSEMAEAARTSGVMLCLALDDDIADASGVNATLAGTYQIDYLDPEHLYRVADLYLLRKNPQARTALHEMYLTFRAEVPGFNWSEPRFASLYPVHPLIADVSAAVRLYSSSFAFLPFAAASAARAGGRPASSLVLLDEVFDRTEQEMRRSDELREAFEVYDELAGKAVGQFPVMERLHAKLVLKSLFIMSLDGRGATASELCAALLYTNENASRVGAVKQIDGMLRRFMAAAPEGLQAREENGSDARYRFEVSSSARFDAALASSVEAGGVDDHAVRDILRVVGRARFDDWPFTDERGAAVMTAHLHLGWRGSERPGQFIWQGTAGARIDDVERSETAPHDWRVVMLAPGVAGVGEEATGAAGETSTRPLSVVWRPAALTTEEASALRRLVVLRTDPGLASKFGETARVAASALHAQAERIWTRIYMNEGALVLRDELGEQSRMLTDEARSTRTLTAALAGVFASHFAERFPQHPEFTETLREDESAALMEGLFGGANVAEEEVQRLARTFAAPLGLAVVRGDIYTLETGDESLGRAWVREVLALVDASGGEAVSLAEVRALLRREPYGFTREAQNLVLAALVAQRRVEFVTTSGDRVSRRTIGRVVRWDEMAGLCRASSIHHSAEELTAWARLLTGQAALPVITDPKARDVVRGALAGWLAGWRGRRVLEKFGALPEAALTTRAWGASVMVRKGFGATAEAVAAALAADVSLDEGLQRVADAFRDSTENFARCAARLAELTEYVEGFDNRHRAHAYLAGAEPTGVGEIESARRELLSIAEDAHALFDAEQRVRFELLWQEFRSRYTEHYAEAHERAVGGASDRRAIDALRRTENWREFEALARLPVMSRELWQDVDELLRLACGSRCDLPVRQLLADRPTCACSFRLAHAETFERLPQKLEERMERGRAVYRRTLAMLGGHLAIALDALARKESDAELVRRARALSVSFAQGQMPACFSRLDVRFIERALRRMAAPPPVSVRLPAGGEELFTRERLRARLGNWLDELPEPPVLIDVIAETGSNAP